MNVGEGFMIGNTTDLATEGASSTLIRGDSLERQSPPPGKIAKDKLVGASVVSHKIAGSKYTLLDDLPYA